MKDRLERLKEFKGKFEIASTPGGMSVPSFCVLMSDFCQFQIDLLEVNHGQRDKPNAGADRQ
jgi:hypothetical protein